MLSFALIRGHYNKMLDEKRWLLLAVEARTARIENQLEKGLHERTAREAFEKAKTQWETVKRTALEIGPQLAELRGETFVEPEFGDLDIFELGLPSRATLARVLVSFIDEPTEPSLLSLHDVIFELRNYISVGERKISVGLVELKLLFLAWLVQEIDEEWRSRLPPDPALQLMGGAMLELSKMCTYACLDWEPYKDMIAPGHLSTVANRAWAYLTMPYVRRSNAMSALVWTLPSMDSELMRLQRERGGVCVDFAKATASVLWQRGHGGEVRVLDIRGHVITAVMFGTKITIVDLWLGTLGVPFVMNYETHRLFFDWPLEKFDDYTEWKSGPRPRRS